VKEFINSALSASTVVDCLNGRRCTYNVGCNKIVEEVKEFRAKEFFFFIFQSIPHQEAVLENILNSELRDRHCY
jgi:hypothetical protein